ncbi:hypothetical protein LTS17_001321 [Exophiala oligosperma]
MDSEKGYGDTIVGPSRRSQVEIQQQEDAVGSLDPAHVEYLIQRHGTVELEPLPSMDPLDPFNWPSWRKNLFLALFAFHGMMAGYVAAGLVPALPLMAKKYGVSLTASTYLASVSIAIYSVVPFLWLPLMDRIGRRPSLLLSAFGAAICNVGGVFCETYGTQMATRVLTALFIAPPTALGGIIVTELFFVHERGTKTGIWKLLFTIGAPAGPFILGFVTKFAGLRWVYGVMALTCFGLFLSYVLFCPETKYERNYYRRGCRRPASCGHVVPSQPSQLDFMKFCPVDLRKPWSWKTFLRPLTLFFSAPRIILPICAYAIVFAYANVAICLTVPQVAGEKFHLDSEGIGLQFIAIMVGLVLGELLGGFGSDRWMTWRISKRGGNRVIEDRLWLSYPGIVLVVVGLVLWGVKTQQAREGHWIVSPSIGAAIASFGCQVITTVLVTYAIDVDPIRSADTGLVINLVRQLWAFVSFAEIPSFPPEIE